MRKIEMKEIFSRFDKLKGLDKKFDLVVGIARGGIIPASIAAYKTGSFFKVVTVSYRDDKNVPKYNCPKVKGNTTLPKNAKRVLLVDDVSVTGKTFLAAKKAMGIKRAKTLVLSGKADYVLFPEIKECVRWPWTF